MIQNVMKDILYQYWIVNILAALALLGLITALYILWARPYQLTWGATQEEIERPMPGDELDPDPDFLATRAITIDAPPETIWPWLIQMAYNRAGFYGYDILENIGSEQGLRSADRILPQFQDFEVGGEVPISAIHSMAFYAIEPNEYLIWVGEGDEAPGGFTWALYPIDDNQTRLVSRIRWSYHFDDPGSVLIAVFTDLADHIAVREILQGIKGRVEGQIEPMARQNLEFFVYVAAFGVFVYALIALILRPLSWTTWLTGLGVGIVWMVTWYAPISVWISLLLIATTIWRLRVLSTG